MRLVSPASLPAACREIVGAVSSLLCHLVSLWEVHPNGLSAGFWHVCGSLLYLERVSMS